MKSENRVVEAVVIPSAGAPALPNRWAIAAAGVAIQMMLGTVYAWSVFKTPIKTTHGWVESNVGITFALAIFFLGFSAALGGRLVDKAGTRTVASIAAVLFGAGTILGGLAHQTGQLWLLWLGYGVIGGIGNGLGYVTPVAVLVRWFPDKKGFITGLAVMGFGLGAAFMSLIGQAMINKYGDGLGVYGTFYVAGTVFIVGILLAARMLVNPPAGYALVPSAGKAALVSVISITPQNARKMPQLYILWAILFLNVAAGIALLSNLKPMAMSNIRADDNSRITAMAASAIVMMGSFCNGFGRLFWGGLSEKIGRRNVFLLLFLTQIPPFILLPHVTSYWAFAVIACYILLCYGGGFGTMPSFTADTFGPKNIGAIYGAILLAWGVAGGVGPGLMEWFYATTKKFDIALYIAAGLLALGLLATLLYRKPKPME